MERLTKIVKSDNPGKEFILFYNQTPTQKHSFTHSCAFLTQQQHHLVLKVSYSWFISTNNLNLKPLFHIAEEITEVKSELEQEGFTPDEAARLIQQVYRKIRNKGGLRKNRSVESMGSTGVTCEAKSWDSAMMELKKLMQIIHENNMEFHGVIKKSKEAVDLGDIKSVSQIKVFNLLQYYLKIMNSFWIISVMHDCQHDQE